MREPRIRTVRPVTVDVSAKTVWVFVEIETDDGLIGVGEATVNGAVPATVERIRQFAADITGHSASGINAAAAVAAERAVDLPGFAAASAIEIALWDIGAQRLGAPLHQLLGGAVRDRVPIYANINRGASPRTPEGFVNAARIAVDAGYRFIKMAPFDEIDVHRNPAATAADMEPGLARLRAVADAVRGGAELMADVHWRLDEPLSLRLIEEAETLGLYWVECPMPETPDTIRALTRLRREANRRGVRLAGGERETSLAALRLYMEAGCYDVLMPDVKYIGGIAPLNASMHMAAAFGATIAPHNPTGPVCHMASMHVSAAAPSAGFLMLEHQFNESPRFFDCVDGEIPALTGLRDSACDLPFSAGLGVRLNAVPAAGLAVSNA